MSDFIDSFWSFFIILIVLGGIFGCALLAWSQGRAEVPLDADGQPMKTTGHVFDGDLEEYNNPLPRWWMWMFYAAVIFGLVYLTLYPGLGYFKGRLGWTSHNQYDAEIQEIQQRLGPMYQRYLAEPSESLAKDPKAMATAERLFLNNCAQCHGSDAHGNVGFPNLTDETWLYGGEPDKIKASITLGRQGMMPSMLAAIGGEAEAHNVAQYVMSLSNKSTDSKAAAAGEVKFKAICAACHNQDAHGNQLIGAPNLTAGTPLYGRTEKDIIYTITNGRHGVMPAHEKKLTEAQIHLLATYVWSLSKH